MATIKKPPTLTPTEALTFPKFFFYGGSGVGKTHLIGTAAEAPDIFGKILMLCLDPGTMTLANNPAIDSSVEVATIDTVNKLDTWLEYLRSNPNEFKTIVVEGATDLSELVLSRALIEQHEADSKIPENRPGLSHYKERDTVCRRYIRAFRDLNSIVIFSALAKEVDDLSTGKKPIIPSTGGQLGTEIPAYFDIVGYLTTTTKGENVTRILHTNRTDKYVAKDRSRRLNSPENPTMLLLWQYMNDPTRTQLPDSGADLKPKIAKPKL